MLFAAGLGTRLHPLTVSKPKALVEVAGQTLLDRNLNLLALHGIHQVIVNVHHFPEQIIEHLRNSKNPQLEWVVSDESDVLLDTGGGLKKARPFFDDFQPFLVMNADIVTNINIKAMVDKHVESGAIATLAVRQRESSRAFLFNKKNQLCGWQDTKKEKIRMSRMENNLQPLAFSGIQVLSPSIFSHFPDIPIFSLVDLYLEAAKKENIIAYSHDSDFWFDAGSVEKVKEIEHFLSNRR